MNETIPCRQHIPWSTEITNSGTVLVSSPLTRNRPIAVESVVQDLDDRLSEVQTSINLCNECKGVFANCIFL